MDDVGYQDLNEINKIESDIFGEDAFDNNLLRKLVRRNLFFFKLEKTENGKDLIGFIIVVKDQEDRTNIINFAIKPKYQHQGYGSKIFSACINLLIRKNCKTILAGIQVKNKDELKFFEKFGFKSDEEKVQKFYQII